MRVACLYDIHANLPALEAVLSDVREARAERIVVGGDVLPGPMPRECLDLLYSLDIPTDFIIGNGDRETAVAARGTGQRHHSGILSRGNEVECRALAAARSRSHRLVAADAATLG